MQDELIKRLRENPDFQQFLEFLVHEIQSLDSVTGLDKFSNEQAGEEAKVRLLTYKKLTTILSPFAELHERPEPTIEQIQRKKDTYAL